jgi:hypothetical protein
MECVALASALTAGFNAKVLHPMGIVRGLDIGISTKESSNLWVIHPTVPDTADTTNTPATPIPDKTRYLHYDNLGSIDTITDGQGNIVERMSYAAFGE